ncbi:MAG: hypothetical protein ACD_82C00095G0004 [uncultured bacterium]|nr:MAG: hypothetical protein ACD_82C00095G0004 [uncultured bacterium]KKP29349.1 MAG: hypothetical protein UR12_C0009G0010 [candidate division TM6 bacterium GW2011_GWF2_30_66]
MKIKNFFLFVFFIQLIFCNQYITCFGPKNNCLKAMFKSIDFFCCPEQDNFLENMFKCLVNIFVNKNKICDEFSSDDNRCEQFINNKIKKCLNDQDVVDFTNSLNNYLDFDNENNADLEEINKENFYFIVRKRIDKDFLNFLKNKTKNMDFLLKKYDIENNSEKYENKDFIEKEKRVYDRILIARDIIINKIKFIKKQGESCE